MKHLFAVLTLIGIISPFAFLNSDNARAFKFSDARQLSTVAGPTASPANPTTKDSMAAVPDAKVINGLNQFGIELFRGMHPGKNDFISPFSISSSLALTLGGARGETEREMRDVLGIPPDSTDYARSFYLLNENLNGSAGSRGYELATANAIWADRSSSFLAAFSEFARTSFGARIENLDFRSQPESAGSTINHWVEEHTAGHVKQLIAPGSIRPDDRMILTNAIYFKGEWARRFETGMTIDGDFRTGGQSTVRARLMHQLGRFRYAGTKSFQIVELPYNGDQLSMYILLPGEKSVLTDLESFLSADKLANVIAGLHEREVDLFLPKFKMSARAELRENLSSAGMRSAFADSADFSGIDGRKDLFLSSMVHEAFIETDEQGTKAAAASGVKATMISATTDTMATFRADHPFIFLIMDKQSKTILFLGRIVNPTIS